MAGRPYRLERAEHRRIIPPGTGGDIVAATLIHSGWLAARLGTRIGPSPSPCSVLVQVLVLLLVLLVFVLVLVPGEGEGQDIAAAAADPTLNLRPPGTEDRLQSEQALHSTAQQSD